MARITTLVHELVTRRILKYDYFHIRHDTTQRTGRSIVIPGRFFNYVIYVFSTVIMEPYYFHVFTPSLFHLCIFIKATVHAVIQTQDRAKNILLVKMSIR